MVVLLDLVWFMVVLGLLCWLPCGGLQMVGFFVLSLVLLLELAFVVVFVMLCWLPGSSCALWFAFTVFVECMLVWVTVLCVWREFWWFGLT